MLKLLKYEFYNMFRNKWIVFYFLFFLILTASLFYFAKEPAKVVSTLLQIVILVVPLISLILGTIFMYDSRNFIELLLSQPIDRKKIYISKYLGTTISLSVGFILGVLIPYLYVLKNPDVKGEHILYFSLIISGAFMTFIFTAFAFFISTFFEDRVKGFGASILLWLYVTLIYDGIILFIIIYFREYPLEKPVLILSMLNPVDIARIFVILKLDMAALLGYTGTIFKQFFDTKLGTMTSLSVMVLWIVIPLITGLVKFSKKIFKQEVKMKKRIFVITMAISFSASGGITQEEIDSNPILKGKMLAKKCSWCHDINKNLVAPPFKVILERYKSVPENTLRKQFFEVIKNGSKGRWKEWMKENLKIKMGRLDSMYMPPQKEYYNDEEINLILDWLFSLKK
ncbi:MAG: ABC transporter permease subunit [Persephonella sp.]|nr:ABC transporter permease subunit [Persephonella sp.]